MTGSLFPIPYPFQPAPLETIMRHPSTLLQRAALASLTTLFFIASNPALAGENDSPAQVMDNYFKAVQSHAVDNIVTVFASDATIATSDRDITGLDNIRQFYLNGVLKCKNFIPKPGPYMTNGDSLAVEIVLQCDGVDKQVGDFFTMKNGKITFMRVYSGKGYKPN
jgi:hypothetical protein